MKETYKYVVVVVVVELVSIMCTAFLRVTRHSIYANFYFWWFICQISKIFSINCQMKNNLQFFKNFQSSKYLNYRILYTNCIK